MLVILVIAALAATVAGLWVATRNPELVRQLARQRERAERQTARVLAYAEVTHKMRRSLAACSDVVPEAAAILDEIAPYFDEDDEIIPSAARRALPVIVRDPSRRHI